MIIRLYHVVSISTSLFAPSGWHLLDLCLQKFKGWSMLVGLIADFPEINVASGSNLSKSAVVTVIPCHSMSLHHIAPVSCSLWATKRRSRWKRPTFQKLNEIDGAADDLMVLRQMWIGRSHCLVKYDRIRLMSWSWQSHLWTQTEKSLETSAMQTECIRCIGCLSKSVKICQAAIFFFACYGLICHGSEWIARFGQGSKADVWLECIHKGNGLASLATLNAAHSGKDPGTMMKYRAQAIHMIYPHIEDLYCILLKLDWRKFGDID